MLLINIFDRLLRASCSKGMYSERNQAKETPAVHTVILYEANHVWSLELAESLRS